MTTSRMRVTSSARRSGDDWCTPYSQEQIEGIAKFLDVSIQHPMIEKVIDAARWLVQYRGADNQHDLNKPPPASAINKQINEFRALARSLVDTGRLLLDLHYQMHPATRHHVKIGRRYIPWLEELLPMLEAAHYEEAKQRRGPHPEVAEEGFVHKLALIWEEAHGMRPRPGKHPSVGKVNLFQQFVFAAFNPLVVHNGEGAVHSLVERVLKDGQRVSPPE